MHFSSCKWPSMNPSHANMWQEDPAMSSKNLIYEYPFNRNSTDLTSQMSVGFYCKDRVSAYCLLTKMNTQHLQWGPSSSEGTQPGETVSVFPPS